MGVCGSEWLADQIKLFATVERPIYETYAEKLAACLKHAAHESAPSAKIDARAKSVASFAEKAARKFHKYSDPVHQLTDLCGVRVITDTQEEAEAFCRYIRKHFIIDEANSEDKLALLGTTQFGYMSVHFVVQMPPEVPGISVPPEIGSRKAEIQVRTILQHAWAHLAHDRIYKSPFAVPPDLIREMNRAAAILEEVDREFTNVLQMLERYPTGRTFHPRGEDVPTEIGRLQLVSKLLSDPAEKRRLALRIASLAGTIGQWETVESALQPFVSAGDFAILRELGAALCRRNREDPRSAGFRTGLERLEEAIKLNSDDPETHAHLARGYESIDEKLARNHYSRAYELRPTDPYYLMAYLEFQIAVERQFGGLNLLGPALRGAVTTCRAHATAGIEIPRVFFTEAKAQLLLQDADAALSVCAQGIRVALEKGSPVPVAILEEETRSIQRLSPLQDALRGFQTLNKLLRLALTVKTGDRERLSEPASPASARLSVLGPVVIIAGGSETAEITASEQALIVSALDGFVGTVLCGGVSCGTGVIVDQAAKREVAWKSIGYHPRYLPASVRPSTGHSLLVETAGNDLGIEATLQMWVDLLAIGVDPGKVRVIGISGGPLSAVELKIAVALGAMVGVIDDAAGAAASLRKDLFWSHASNLLSIPADPMCWKALCLAGEKLDADWLDSVARVVHEKYCEDNKHKIIDPAMHPWEELDEMFRESNRHQASYALEVLRCTGFGVRKPVSDSWETVAFTSAEVEQMAEMEHGRWTVERLSAGWKPGDRDPDKKLSPYFVRWDMLPEKVKEWDRDAVRKWPDSYRKVGLEIYRLPASAQ